MELLEVGLLELETKVSKTRQVARKALKVPNLQLARKNEL